MQDGFRRSRVERLLVSVNWQTLQQCATVAREEVACQLLSDIGVGGNHMIRILEFSDDIRWEARLRIFSLADPDPTNTGVKMMENKGLIEATTMALIRRKTSIPISRNPYSRVKDASQC
jgi:hypothetical protein